MSDLSIAEQFKALFAGLDRAHGTYDLSPEHLVVQENGKHKGQASTKQRPVTVELWEQHLQGTSTGLGIIPIREDGTVLFAAVDFDIYNSDPALIAKMIGASGFPLVTCRSKSGGAHGYIFLTAPASAEKVRDRLKEMITALGHPRLEIFPSRSTMDDKTTSNWINMPYYNGVLGQRWCIMPDGEALGPEGFLAYAESMKVDPEYFDKEIKAASSQAFPEGPPCLQQLVSLGPIGDMCNNVLLNMGTYAKKAFPLEWEDKLREYNRNYIAAPIIAEKEVQGAIKSLKGKNYYYTCKKPPIEAYCNGVVCRTRKYGVRDGEGEDGGEKALGQMPVLSTLRKLMTDPPIWYWDVDGQQIELTTEQLGSARLFQLRVMEVCNRMFSLPKSMSWETIVDEAMKRLIYIEAPDDSSAEGQLMEYLQKFCTGRAQASTMEEVTMGKPFTKEGKTYFRLMDLIRFVTANGFKELKSNKIVAVMQGRGLKFEQLQIQNQPVDVWITEEYAPPIDGLALPESLQANKDHF